jgi:hypothetical protein
MKSAVKRRFVLYIAGFDPSGPAHYHRLYREHANLQASLQGYEVNIDSRQKIHDYLAQWQVTYRPSKDQVTNSTHTDYTFARWDDIVREHWTKIDSLASLRRFVAGFFSTQWLFLHTGALWKMLRLAWPPVVALVSPLVMVLGVLMLWLATPVLAVYLLNTLNPSAPWYLQLTDAFTGTAVWVLVSVCIVKLTRKIENKFHMLWLMRSYMFTRAFSQNNASALDIRVQEFAKKINQVHASGAYDEVLVVGHSSGCILAILSVAAALDLGTAQPGTSPTGKPNTITDLALLTLGHCTPMLSSLPAAAHFRLQLKKLSDQSALTWIDFSAPPDGCSFAFVDPIAACVDKSDRGPFAPKLLSPRFQTLFSAADYAALRRNRFDLHFQYIKSAGLAGEYDYFAITAGSETLASRYASHRSVIDFTKFRLF